MVGRLGRGRRIEQCRNGLAQLAKCDVRCVALEEVAELLDVAREGAVGAALAVRQGPATHSEASEVLDNAAELGGDAALADAGVSQDRDEVRPALADNAFPDPAEDLEL